MIYEPIIKAHQKKFVESFGLSKCSDSEAFEKFVNYTELLQHRISPLQRKVLTH